MIDKRTLADSVQILKPLGKDDWGNQIYGSSLTLSPVRFDRNHEFQGSGNHRSELKPSVVLVYPKFCSAFIDDSFLGGKVTCDGVEYTVRKIIPQYHPFKKTVLCYEIEVI